jgi:hypothetical protein
LACSIHLVPLAKRLFGSARLSEKDFTRENTIARHFDEIMKGQFDPQEMTNEMVSVIGADGGKYRNVWPPVIEDLVNVLTTAGTWTVD